MPDTAPDCPLITGSGCPLFATPARAECDTATVDSADDTGSGEVVHGSSVCSSALVSPAWCVLVVAAFTALRRRSPLLGAVAAVLASMPSAAFAEGGTDVQMLVPLDGGPAVSLVDAEMGKPWSFAAAVAWSFANAPAVLTTSRGDHALLERVSTTSWAGSVRVANGPRLGVAVPFHDYSFEGVENHTLGDAVFWIGVPLLDAPERPLKLASQVQLTFPSGTSEAYLGESQGAIEGVVAVGWQSGGLDLVANAGVHLAQTVQLPGLAWGTRYRWGFAANMQVNRWALVGAEVWGSGPFEVLVNATAAHTTEALASGGPCFSVGVCLRAGFGGGLTHGLGAPEYRLTAMADWRPRGLVDTDKDGILDGLDGCIREPEDRDRVQDLDGCPETDADADGLDDPVDTCPTDAETRNGFRDEDGCPDSLTILRMTVHASPLVPIELATIEILDHEVVTLVEEPTDIPAAEGPHVYRVSADGYDPVEGEVEAKGARVELEVSLQPILFGDVVLVLTDGADRPIAGYVRRGGSVGEVPSAGAEIRARTGLEKWTVYASGFGAVEVPVEVHAGERLSLRVALAGLGARVDGDRITTERRIAFALDQSQLTTDSEQVIDDIASLLRSRPDIEWLRVEGHADETGNSRHNLDLSRARASVVREALIARGIDPARLEAIGSGEARKTGATRSVEFEVLVWGDE